MSSPSLGALRSGVRQGFTQWPVRSQSAVVPGQSVFTVHEQAPSAVQPPQQPSTTRGTCPRMHLGVGLGHVTSAGLHEITHAPVLATPWPARVAAHSLS